MSVKRQKKIPSGIRADLRIALKHHRAGRIEDAVEVYKSVLELMPDHAETLVGLGAAMLSLGRCEDAIIPLEKASIIRPDHSGTCFSLAEAYRGVGRIKEAYKVGVRGLEGKPDYIQGHIAVADALFDMEQYDQAQVAFENIFARNPHDPIVLGKYGTFQYNLGDFSAAENKLTIAAESLPADIGIQWHRAILNLSQRRWSEGWKLYSWRWPMAKRNSPENILDLPIWNGESLVGKRIVVWNEQGLGDELMFSSCLADFLNKARPDLCVLACDPRLASVFGRSFANIVIFPMDRNASEGTIFQIPACDVQIAAGSIPKFVRTKETDFPSAKSWLIADPNRAVRWREQLDTLGPGLKVGVAWRGGTLERFKRTKSSDLVQWEEILRVPGVQFVNLQYDFCRDDLEVLRSSNIIIHDFQELDPIAAPDDQMALISELDLVIQTSNASAHMAGVLGVPVWNIVPFVPDWRWGIETETCPWYASMRLFRQPSLGAWGPVFSQVAKELYNLVR